MTARHVMPALFVLTLLLAPQAARADIVSREIAFACETNGTVRVTSRCSKFAQYLTETVPCNESPPSAHDPRGGA
jgi:hypothetical protein